jgi:hypothetical protein
MSLQGLHVQFPLHEGVDAVGGRRFVHDEENFFEEPNHAYGYFDMKK